MSKGFKICTSGSGSERLNFNIVAYDTEEALKAASPVNNTVGVVTRTSISNWIFSATEPSEKTTGMIWFGIGESSDYKINALTKNVLELYIISVKQYVSSAWVDLIYRLYQDGEWLERKEIYLYNAGDECESDSGGWTITGLGSKKADHIYIGSESNYGSTENSAKTNKTIDCSRISSVEVHFIEFWTSTSVGFCEVRLVNEGGATVAKARHGYSDNNSSSRLDFVLTVDAKDITEKCYVHIVAAHTTSSRNTRAKVDTVRCV